MDLRFPAVWRSDTARVKKLLFRIRPAKGKLTVEYQGPIARAYRYRDLASPARAEQADHHLAAEKRIRG